MAEHTSTEGGHPDMDYAEHVWTYEFFLKLMKWIVVVVVLVLIFLAYMWG